MLTTKFLESYSDLIKNEKYDFLYSDYFVIDADGNIVEEMCLPEFSKKEIFSRGDFLATGTLYRRDLLDSLGGYEELIVNSGWKIMNIFFD